MQRIALFIVANAVKQIVQLRYELYPAAQPVSVHTRWLAIVKNLTPQTESTRNLEGGATIGQWAMCVPFVIIPNLGSALGVREAPRPA
jgi:hypothetical protein